MNTDSQCQAGAICEGEAPNTVPYHVGETKMWRRALDTILQSIKSGSEYPKLLGGAQVMRQLTKEELDAKKATAVDSQPVRSSRERSLAITKLQEAIMWLGMDLKDQDTPTPYPHSYDPSSPVIDKTADGLRL